MSELTRPFLLGLFLAALLITLFPPGFLGRLVPPGPIQYLFMLLAGIPLYMCSTGSLPLAFGFYLQGFSPGSLLVFLLSGPATNATSLVVIKETLGKRVFVLYLTSLVVFSLLAGIALDLLGTKFSLRGAITEGKTLSWVNTLSALVLGALLVGHFVRSLKTKAPPCSCPSKN